jgi:hypothetical protein
MKYLRDQPFQVGGSTEAYREGWERVFGKKCVICKGTGEIAKVIGGDHGQPDAFTMGKTACTVCGGSGKERPPS